MTIRQLIELLKKEDPDKNIEVVVNHYTTNGFCDNVYGITAIEQRDHGITLLSFENSDGDSMYNADGKYFRKSHN